MAVRLTLTDKVTLTKAHISGTLRPSRDVPGQRKVHAKQLRYLNQLAAKGWLAADPDYAESFVLTQAGADMIGVEMEEP